MASEVKQKAPAFQFYVRDWLTDSQLQAASPETRGIWINAICLMWLEPDQGVLEGTRGELSQILNASPRYIRKFIDEVEALRFCDVSVVKSPAENLTGKISQDESKTRVRLVNRRMRREAKARKRNALYQARFRSKFGSKTRVRPPSDPSASASSSASAFASSSASATATASSTALPSLGFSGGGGNRQGSGFSSAARAGGSGCAGISSAGTGGDSCRVNGSGSDEESKSTPRHLPTPPQRERHGKPRSLREALEARGLLMSGPPANATPASGATTDIETPAAAGKGGNE